MSALGEALESVMRRAGVGSTTLSKLTGVPRTAIDNWREGIVRHPRHWRPLLEIARVLSLSPEETDRLLAAAGFPGIAALADELPEEHPDRDRLHPWLRAAQWASHLALYQLRASTADFVGRTGALETLLAALRGNRGAAVAAITGVRGMGGIGKTELAVLAAHRVRDMFPDAQLVLELRGVSANPVPAGQALRQVIRAFLPDAQLGDDIDELQRRYCALLSGRRALVLADDARDADQVRPLLPPSGCALLVTSRQRFTLPGMTTVDLDELSEVEAVRLVRATCRRVTVRQARTVAELCGNLPLALRISGSLLHNDPALPVPEFLASLADGRRLALLRDPDDPHLDVGASLALSYARLDGAAQLVFRQLGAFVSDFSSELASAVVETSAGVEVTATLRLLLRRNLVGYDSEHRRWRLHDLVRDLARGYLDAAGEWEATMWRYADATVRIAESTREQYVRGGDSVLTALTRLDVDGPHLDAGRRWAAAHAGSDRADRLLVAGLVATFYLVVLRPDYQRELMPQTHHALAAAQRLGDRHDEGVILHLLGNLYLEQCDLDRATGYFEQQLGIAQADGDRSGQARALNNLSAAYQHAGQFRRAIPLNEEHLALAQAAGDPRAEAMAWCNLGHAQLNLGRPGQALTGLHKALAIVRELGHRNGECAILANIGIGMLHLGEAARATELLNQALAIAEAMDDRRSQAQIHTELSRAAVAADQAQLGVEYAIRAAATAREIGAHRLHANSLWALGEAHAANADTAGARATLETALDAARVAGDRYAEAGCRWQLGLALAGDHPRRAVQLLEAAVGYYREIGHSQAAERGARLDRLAAERAPEPSD